MKYKDCKINQLRKILYNSCEKYSMYYEKDRDEFLKIYNKITRMNREKILLELNVKENDELNEKIYKSIKNII